MLKSTSTKYAPRASRNQDPEAQSTTPLLCSESESSSANAEGQRDEDDSKYKTYSGLPAVLDFFSGGVYAPGASTHSPIEILLNTKDEEERDRLTENWKDNRLNELSFVGVVAALLAGVLTSTGSWPTILPNGKASPWPVRTAWYCGIVLSVFSILAAADQTVRLYRMSSHQDGTKQIRALLARSNGKRSGGRLRPGMAQVYTWQMPVMFLTTAAICMIVGLFLHVWSAIGKLDHETWFSDDFKVAIVFTIIAGISIIVFFVGQVTIYVPQVSSE